MVRRRSWRTREKSTYRPAPAFRRLRLEPLEDRRLLSLGFASPVTAGGLRESHADVVAQSGTENAIEPMATTVPAAAIPDSGSDVASADVARIGEFLGNSEFEILDTWSESRRTLAGSTRFRMYKVSTGQYFGIDGEDGSVYDSEGFAVLANAAMEALSPVDKLSPVLHEMSNDWGDTQLVTVQLVMPEEAQWLVQRALDAEESEEDVSVATQAPRSVAANGAAVDSSGLDEDMNEQLRLRLDALRVQETAHAGVIDQFLTRNEVPADHIVYRYRYAPAVAINAAWEECLVFAADPTVTAIHHEATFEAENERSVASAKTRSAWVSGYDGTGAVIAVVEHDKIQTSGYLSATVRPGSYTAGDHPTTVGGIIRSTHSFFKGHANGSTLLSAPAGSWNQTDLVAATEWALAQGAMVVNCSFGLDSTDEFTWSDVYYDYVSANSRVLVVKSAGNNGNYVTSPGKGFNVLTVGNISGGTSPSWTGDSMSASSSWRNPGEPWARL